MVICGIEIEIEANEDAGARLRLLAKRNLSQGRVGGLQHQHLLRQCFLQFARRNAKAVCGDVQMIDIEASE